MISYLRSVGREFSRIRWLPIKKAALLTILVFFASVAIGFFISFLDNVILFVLNAFSSL